MGIHVACLLGARHGHHKEEGNTEAGYVYIVMANLGALVLLLAFGLLAGPK